MYARHRLQLTEPILSAESARSLGRAMATIAGETDSVQKSLTLSSSQSALLELHSWWSGSARPGAQVSHNPVCQCYCAICGHAKLMLIQSVLSMVCVHVFSQTWPPIPSALSSATAASASNLHVHIHIELYTALKPLSLTFVLGHPWTSIARELVGALSVLCTS